MESQGVADVFLLAENRLLREALVRILSKKSDIRVVGAAPYSLDTQAQVIAARPSIVLLDSLDPIFSDARLVATLQSAIPGVRIVVVDMELEQA